MEKQVKSVKSENTLINGIDVRRLTTHKTLHQLNDTVNYIVFSYFAKKRHKNYVSILRYLAQYSVRFLGVSWRRIEGIAHDLGIDERTVRRVLSKLQKLGVIKRIKTRKVSGLRGVDIIVINAAEVQAEMDVNEVQTDRELAECPSKVSEHKAIKTYKTSNKTIDNDDDIGASARNVSESSNESIDSMFESAAESAGLPAETRGKVLARIKKYAAGIGNFTAYITAAVKRAVDSINALANVHSNASTDGNNRAETQRKQVGNVVSRATFEDAVKASVARQNGRNNGVRITPLPTSIAQARERDKTAYESGKVAQQAESYEETKQRIQALLAQMQK